MNLPDRIIAVGGAGKAIAYEMLSAEWIQESIIEPRPDPRSLTVTIIDTAQEERNRDLEKIQDLRNEISEKTEEMRGEGTGRMGSIEIEYLPITENIQLHDQNDLIGENSVPRIASGNGMDPDNWWLDSDHINENLDFATGVVRKRGLGKAIYYKSYAEDDSVSTSIDLPNKGKVAVLAGLGGGTGSGVFLDLVKDLKQSKRTAEITLFAVLPNDSEPALENANAHAALSEMEYLSLSGENLFKDRILIPIDPTGFGGKTANMIQSSEPLEEFDKASVYLIVSYYNMMDMEDPFADIPSYAPFTIGIPQVLRYNVDAIKGAKSSIKEMLNEKEDALEAESQVYTDVDRFLTRNYGTEASGIELNDSSTTDLESRLQSVEELMGFELFSELNYESVSVYQDIIDDARQEASDITDQIDIISGSMRAGSARLEGNSENFVDTVDQQLSSVIQEELDRLSFRKELLGKLSMVEDNRVRGTLNYLVGQEGETINPGVRINRLEAKLEEASERKESLESDLREAEKELEARVEEQSSKVERKVSDWESKVATPHEDLQEARSIDIEGLTAELEQAVEEYARQIENCDSPDDIEQATGGEVQQKLTEIENEVARVNTSISDEKSEVNAALNDLSGAKESFLKMTEDEGTIEKIVPWESSSEEERRDAERNYNMKRTQLDDSRVFSVSRAGDSLSVNVDFSADQIVASVEERVSEAEDEVVAGFEDVLEKPQDHMVAEYRSEVEEGASLAELRTIAEDAFEKEIGGTSDIRDRKESLEEELEEVTEQAELYNATVELFEEVNPQRDEFVGYQADYNDQRTGGEHDVAGSVSTNDDDYIYVKTTKPQDVLRVRGDSDIAQSRLFDDQQERQRLRGHLESMAEKSHNPKYNGIAKRRISSDRSRYNDMQVVVGVVSRAVDQIADVADLQDVFEGAYNTGTAGDSSSGYASFAVPTGGSWDIGLGMFVGGIFLDNLRKETNADGYYSGYKEVEQSEDTDILIHHTAGLEDGYYTRRKAVANMESKEDVEFFLGDDKVIKDQLLKNYVEKVPIDEGDMSGDSDGVDD